MNNLKLYNYYQTICLEYEKNAKEIGEITYLMDLYPQFHSKMMKFLSLELSNNNKKLISSLKSELKNDIDNIAKELNVSENSDLYKNIINYKNCLDSIELSDNKILFNKYLYLRLINADLTPLSDIEKNELLNSILEEISTNKLLDNFLKPKYNNNVKNQYYQIYYDNNFVYQSQNVSNLLYYCDEHNDSKTNETINLNFINNNNEQISRQTNKKLITNKLYYNTNYDNYKMNGINDNLQHKDYIIGDLYTTRELEEKYKAIIRKYNKTKNTKEEIINNLTNTFINNIINNIQKLKFNRKSEISLFNVLDYCVVNFNYDRYIDNKYFNNQIIKFINTYVSCIYPTEYRVSDTVISKYFMSLIYNCIMDDSYATNGSVCNFYGMYKYTQNKLDAFIKNIETKIGQINDYYDSNSDNIRKLAEKNGDLERYSKFMDVNYIKYIKASIKQDFKNDPIYQTNGLILGLKYLYQTMIDYFNSVLCPQYQILQDNISKFDEKYENNEFTNTFENKMKEIITNIFNKTDSDNAVRLYKTFVNNISLKFNPSDFKGRFFDDQNINFYEQTLNNNFYKPIACDECCNNLNQFNAEQLYTCFEDINIIIQYLNINPDAPIVINKLFSIINGEYVLNKDLTIDDFRFKKYNKLIYKWKLNVGSKIVEQKIDDLRGFKYYDIENPITCKQIIETNVIMIYNSLLIKAGSILLDKDLINNMIILDRNLWKSINNTIFEKDTVYITNYKENKDNISYTYDMPNFLAYTKKNDIENKLISYNISTYEDVQLHGLYNIPNNNTSYIKYSDININYSNIKKIIINKNKNYIYKIPVNENLNDDINKMNKILNSLSNQYYLINTGKRYCYYYINYMKLCNKFSPKYYDYIIMDKPYIKLDDGEIIQGELLKEDIIIYDWLPKVCNVDYTIIEDTDDENENNENNNTNNMVNESLISINISSLTPVKFNTNILVKDFNELMLRKCFPDGFKDKLILSENILNEITGDRYNINQRKIKETLAEFGKYPLYLERYFMNSSINYKLLGLFQLKCTCKISNLPKICNYLNPDELTYIENEVIVQGENMIIVNNKIISNTPIYFVGLELGNNKIYNIPKIKIINPSMLSVNNFQQFSNLYCWIELYLNDYKFENPHIVELTNITYGILKNQKYITQF